MGGIEKTNATPLYLQLKNKIKREIRTGMLQPGEKIPSEAQLQKEYGMSRVTVRAALWHSQICCACQSELPALQRMRGCRESI